MDKTCINALLFDFYGELLPEKQKNIYEMYYFLDFSLAEIAENVGLTRQGVRDALTRAVKALDGYEGRLLLSASYREKKRLINEITGDLKQLSEMCAPCANAAAKTAFDGILTKLAKLDEE